MAKTGTHTLAALFSHSLRAAHEPDAEALMNLVLSLHEGRLRRPGFVQLVARLFDRMHLELNVSQLNGVIVDTLIELYPGAKFILTWRDCESWARSFINHQLTRALAPGSAWAAFRDLRFRPAEHPHRSQDRALAERGLYALGAYSSYWVGHNRRVLAAIPAAQLLIVPTDRLQHDVRRMGEFMGIDTAAVHGTQFEGQFEGVYIASPLDALDPVYVAAEMAAGLNQLRAEFGDRIPSLT